MTKLSDLNLYIEELILQGVKGNPDRIREAVEQELARLFADQGTAPTLQRQYNYANFDNSHLEIKPSARIDNIASQVSQHIYTRLSGNL